MQVKASLLLFPEKKHSPVGWVKRSETQQIISMLTTKILFITLYDLNQDNFVFCESANL